MRGFLTVLLIAATGLAGCARVDEMTSNNQPARTWSGPPGYRIATESGDTVESLSQRYDVSSAALIQANHLQPPYRLAPNQTLIIPPPARYRVRPGDTVEGIAAMLGIDEGVLARANGLEQPYRMKIGQILTVPGGIGGEGGPAMAEEDGSTEAPPPRSAISTEQLAPPPGIAEGPGAGISGAPPSPPPSSPPVASGVASQPHSLAPPVAASSPTALAPTGNQSAAPTAIVPSAAASQSESAAPTAPQAPASQPQQQAMIGAPPHFIKPVAGQVTQGFGPDGSGQTNDGINIAAPAGAPVQAAAAGTVIYTGNELAAFGNLVLIRHAGGWVTAYGHLASIAVARGATVTQGQTIGAVGQTGSAASPQLHFEIRQGSKPVDPAPYLGSTNG